MLLLSFSRIAQHVFILNMLLTIVQVECIFSSSAAAKARGRSQSMRTIVRKTEFDSNPQPASSASSSASLVDTKLKPNVHPSSSSSTSTADKQKNFKLCEHDCLKEVEIQPIVAEETISGRRLSGISLSEVSAGTNSGGHLNPARHGVRARIRNILHRYGAAAAVGSAIGASGFYVGRNFSNQISDLLKNNTEKYFSSTPYTVTIADQDEIVNQL